MPKSKRHRKHKTRRQAHNLRKIGSHLEEQRRLMELWAAEGEQSQAEAA